MTLAQAKQMELADFPFPATAHNIYYAGYADWVIHETLIRFDATADDCKTVIPQIIRWDDYVHMSQKPSSYRLEALKGEARLPTPNPQFLPGITWWTDVVIERGFFAGEDSSNKPQVWVDSELNRVYFYESD